MTWIKNPPAQSRQNDTRFPTQRGRLAKGTIVRISARSLWLVVTASLCRSLSMAGSRCSLRAPRAPRRIDTSALGVLLSVLLLPAIPANATIIADVPVEQGFGWGGDPAWWSDCQGHLTPCVNEGAEVINLDTVLGSFAAISLAGTLEEGTYVVEFALGNYSNFPFPTTVSIDFAGLELGDATSTSTPTPAPGAWELWSISWTVDGSNPNLGSALDFTITTSSSGQSNTAFDGVGSLSSSGSGFVISFTPVPEPSTGLLLGLAFSVLAWGRRTRSGTRRSGRRLGVLLSAASRRARWGGVGAALAAGIALPLQPARALIVEDLWGYWSMDGDVVTDSSGNGRTLTNNTSVTLDTTNQKAGSGTASFSPDHFLSVSGFPTGNTSVTFAAWFWLANSPTLFHELGYGVVGVGTTANHRQLLIRAGQDRLVNDGNHHMHVGADLSASSDDWHTSTATISVQDWVYTVVTYDATLKTVTSYINGVLDQSIELSDPLDLGAGALRIGGDVYNDNFMNGRIDEVAAWTRALDAAEVASLFQANGRVLAVPEPATLLLFATALAGARAARRGRRVCDPT